MSRPGTLGASGAWGLGVVGAGAAAQAGLSGNLPGSEGGGPLAGFWSCTGWKSWLAACVRPPAGTAAHLGFSQCDAHSLAAGVGAARLLEPEKSRGCCTGVCWAEARCQPVPPPLPQEWRSAVGGPHVGHLAGPQPLWVSQSLPLGPGGGRHLSLSPPSLTSSPESTSCCSCPHTCLQAHGRPPDSSPAPPPHPHVPSWEARGLPVVHL